MLLKTISSIDLTKKATELLGTIRSSLDLIKLYYQKVIILAYLTDYYAFFSQKRAQQSLSDALELLNYVEPRSRFRYTTTISYCNGQIA